MQFFLLHDFYPNSIVLYVTDPSEMRESWRLSEGFVAEEGKSLLPNLAKTRYIDQNISYFWRMKITLHVIVSPVQMCIGGTMV
jgi:hypothetical protein